MQYPRSGCSEETPKKLHVRPLPGPLPWSLHQCTSGVRLLDQGEKDGPRQEPRMQVVMPVPPGT